MGEDRAARAADRLGVERSRERVADHLAGYGSGDEAKEDDAFLVPERGREVSGDALDVVVHRAGCRGFPRPSQTLPTP